MSRFFNKSCSSVLELLVNICNKNILLRGKEAEYSEEEESDTEEYKENRHKV